MKTRPTTEPYSNIIIESFEPLFTLTLSSLTSTLGGLLFMILSWVNIECRVLVA